MLLPTVVRNESMNGIWIMDATTKRPRHANAIRKAILRSLIPGLVLFLIAPSIGNAQQAVTTNITSSGLGTVGPLQPPSDGVYNITGGTRPGDGPNLFHSFGDFSVGQGDIANFLNDTQLPTSNILGRITGGNTSNIYGTIQTTDFGNANLFLVNPSGIVFGPNGSVNVGGSVSFSTAQYLRLFDSLNGESANFYADPANDGLANSVLAVAPVVDFGFLIPAAYGFLAAPDPSAAITVQGSALSVLPGQSISLVGGKVVIQGDTLEDGTVQQQAHLSAPNGTILLASVSSPGEFDVATLGSLPNVDGTSFTSFGSVALAADSHIDVNGASTVFIKGGQIVLSVNDTVLTTSQTPSQPGTVLLNPGSSITTSNSGAEPGADVQITVGKLQLDGATVNTINSGDGDGGNISINSRTVTVGLANGASVTSSTGFDPTTFMIGGSGNGGNVTVQGLQGLGSAADSVILSNGATISTVTVLGLGLGGNLLITADTLMIENASGVSTDTLFGGGVGGNLSLNVGMLTLTGGDFGGSAIRTSNGSGADLDGDGILDIVGVGGNVTIQGIYGAGTAADSVVLSGGSQIAITSEVGDGGQLSIATKSLHLDGTDLNGIPTTINSIAFGFGHGGSMVLSVGDASLSGGATITSSSFVELPLDHPDPTAGAGGSVTVQGLNGDESKADSLNLAGFRSGIISDAVLNAPPGDIAVHAKTVSLTDGAVIEGGDPFGNGTGGIVNIVADSVGIIGGSHISSQARAQDAGQVTITADRLTLDNGSIETTTASDTGGRGGDVVLNVGSVSLANGSTINSSTSLTGPAGDITMTVGTLSLANGSSISSASTGTDPVTNFIDGTTLPPGTAGNVVITAAGGFTSDASRIATSAEANHGGDISLTADSVQLSGGTVITASSKAPLEVTRLVLDQDGQLVPQIVGDGNAGNITVHSGSTFVMNNSSMTTEATQASGGQVVITAPEMVQLSYSKISTSVAGSAVDTAGGNVTIDPQFVVLQNSQIRANAFAGSGGAIDIIATSAFIADPASIVDASSTKGISGTVNIQSPLQNVGGELTALSQEFSSAAALLAQQCAARAADGTFSTFVVAAREGLPAEPGGFLASPSLTAELLGSRLSGRDPQTQLSAITGLFPQSDARPIRLAKLGDTCHR